MEDNYDIYLDDDQISDEYLEVNNKLEDTIDLTEVLENVENSGD